MRTMVLEDLPTKLGHKYGVDVGIHIPAPWFAYGTGYYSSRPCRYVELFVVNGGSTPSQV